METRRVFGTTLCAAALLFALAGPAQSQDAGVVVDARGGIAVPGGGEWSDLVDVGPTFGIGVGYKVHPRVNVRVDGDIDLMPGADVPVGQETRVGPDMTLVHYVGGAEVELTEPGASAWTAKIKAGAGATTTSSDDFEVNGETTDFSHTYFTFNGGLSVGYQFTDQIGGFVGGQWYEALADEEDTEVFRDFSETQVLTFTTISQFPLTAGLSIEF